MTAETEYLSDLWTMLTDNLDYHAKKFYQLDDSGSWSQITISEFHKALSDFGADPEPTFRQFIYRDQESHARPTEDVLKAQLRFKI